ncbi:heparan-alpha-glucosaminide N-acetyltransferase domain-containing protein [Planctomonas psychrotolerans]|uniref:heparan-alpha-glucosaminide N-acetyltransferase domain-containing protein n=1 Tax=Planctomonas psychrotolerans TaxID=2528712 RepID=UPI00123BE171|nr:heparan-alpha-glucosaminide N-acetyltransferase domain-containing protein [Planctomonas psychrotolerans]
MPSARLSGAPRPEDSASRLHGIDVARGLAVLGMMAAHVGIRDDFDFASPDTWLGVVDGRSSILFATLAGVSIALMSGRTRPLAGDDLVRVRLRILIRAVVIFAIGGLLTMLATPVGVILEFYAVMFALSLPFLRVHPRQLFALAAAFALLAPLVDLLLVERLDQSVLQESVIVELVVTGQYPVLIWLTFVFTGLGIGRLDLTSARIQGALVVAGTLLAMVGYSFGVFTSRALAALPEADLIFTVEPHSGSVFEVVGSGGFAMAVLGLCLWATDRLRPVLFPLEATGAMALTAYTLHIVAIAALLPSVGPRELEVSDNSLYLAFLFVTLAAATVWRLTLGVGPLERALTWLTRRAAPGAPPRPSPRVPLSPPVSD